MKDKSLFETVLASTVHDMKNSLSLVLAQLDQISQQINPAPENQQTISTLRYEASRINLSLMQMLTLYKLDNHQLQVNTVEVEMADFIDDCIASHSLLAQNKNIRLEVECDDFLVWFFDPDMISIAINNIIGNSIRYTRTRVLVSVRNCQRASHQGLIIEISDDGEGYPEIMLEEPENFIKRVNYSTGSTGLGLFFSATVASSHTKGDHSGSIKLDNQSAWNGGRFELFLP